ncbi:lymphocyte antigen 6K isoform X1 [Fukomys damarensis]|uniref:lymphocyte antigen 6K isoform X1 n=1 Tax=Fukomys damarensis TaxID=885580 RepID=UPI00053FF636|nr:lymphocyte antigen 6K isoform X1 [Fukomys damarensis]
MQVTSKAGGVNTSDMRLLLALFLFVALSLGLQHVETDNRTKRQDALMCHICESENNFGCSNRGNCAVHEKYCVIVVTKILRRFFIVSKQCVAYCPAVQTFASEPAKPFLLEKPMPFLYIRCCTESLCNMEGPDVSEDTFREQVGRAYKKKCSHIVSTLLTVLSTAFAGLGKL